MHRETDYNLNLETSTLSLNTIFVLFQIVIVGLRRPLILVLCGGEREPARLGGGVRPVAGELQVVANHPVPQAPRRLHQDRGHAQHGQRGVPLRPL